MEPDIKRQLRRLKIKWPDKPAGQEFPLWQWMMNDRGHLIGGDDLIIRCALAALEHALTFPARHHSRVRDGLFTAAICYHTGNFTYRRLGDYFPPGTKAPKAERSAWHRHERERKELFGALAYKALYKPGQGQRPNGARYFIRGMAELARDIGIEVKIGSPKRDGVRSQFRQFCEDWLVKIDPSRRNSLLSDKVYRDALQPTGPVDEEELARMYAGRSYEDI